MVLGLRPSTRAINEISVGAMKQITSHENSVGEISVGAMKQIPSHENSVGAVGQCGKFSGCPRARAPLSVIFPIQCNNDYYSEPSG